MRAGLDARCRSSSRSPAACIHECTKSTGEYQTPPSRNIETAAASTASQLIETGATCVLCVARGRIALEHVRGRALSDVAGLSGREAGRSGDEAGARIQV